MQPTSSKPLGAFSLVMINIIAIANLRSLVFSAEFGLALVGVYLIASICFLIPVGFVISELATTWPNKGGLYVWIKEAFGKKTGLVIVWIQWIFNVVWFPIALAFIVGTIGYIFNLEWAQNKNSFLLIMTALFWLATFANCFGMKVSGTLSNIGALVGTLIPMLIIISLGYIWVINGNPCHIDWSWQALFPTNKINTHWPFLVEVVFGLVGLELSAMHADQVRNPEKSFPKAIFWSIIIIFITLVSSSLSIAIIIPNEEINHITGISQALNIFFQTYQLKFLNPIINILIIIGSLGGVATWIIGPAKGLLVAAEDGLISKRFAKTNRHQVPINILYLQAILFTIVAFCYVWMPNLESAYILLTAMTTQLSLIIYIALFAAAWTLRKKHPNKPRPYKIYGNVKGITICCSVGIITAIVVILLGFIPPDKIIAPNYKLQYVITLVVGMLLLCLPPFFAKRLDKN